MKLSHMVFASQSGWLTWIPIAIAILTNLHSDLFFYSHDVPKWLGIDLLLSVFILNHRHDLKLKATFISIVYLFLVYWMFSSLLWASNVLAGVEFLVRFILFGLSILVLVTCYRPYQRVRLLLMSSLLSSSLFIVIFVIERWMLKLPYSNGDFTPIGFTNNAGHVFNLWIPALLYFSWKYRNQALVVVPVLLVVSGVLYVLNISDIRTTVLGLALGVLFLYLTRLLDKHPSRKYWYKVAILMSVIVMASGVAYSSSRDALPTTLMSSVRVLEQPIESYRPRLNMLVNSWDMLVDNPFGVGANNFEYHHPEYAKPGTPLGSEFVNERQILKTPHNFLAKVFTELGWPGGLAFSLIYCWLFIQAILFVRRQPEHWWVFVGFIALMLHSLMSQVFISPMSFIFSILLFSALVGVNPQEHGETSSKMLSKFLAMVLLVPMLTVANTVSHFYHYQGVKQNDISKLEKSVRINPGNEAAWLDLSGAYFRSAQDLTRAREASESFLLLNPNHIYGRFYYSQLSLIERDCSTSVRVLARLLQTYPSYKDAQLLMNKSLDCRAREQNNLLTRR